MAGELDAIVQRMIDAGEDEANIATVIQGYQPSDPRQARKQEAMAFWHADKPRGESLGSAAMQVGLMAAMGGASKLPLGRLLTTGAAAGKAALANAPIIGKPLRAAAKAGSEAWKASAPAAEATVAAPAAPAAASGVKPKLSAQEVAAALRTNYGSEKAGRMLYGPVRTGVSASARKEAIKRLAPGESQLPASAATRMNKEIAASTGDEALGYAAKAKSGKAREYLSDLLRASLLAKMQGK